MHAQEWARNWEGRWEVTGELHKKGPDIWEVPIQRTIPPGPQDELPSVQTGNLNIVWYFDMLHTENFVHFHPGPERFQDRRYLHYLKLSIPVNTTT